MARPMTPHIRARLTGTSDGRGGVSSGWRRKRLKRTDQRRSWGKSFGLLLARRSRMIGCVHAPNIRGTIFPKLSLRQTLRHRPPVMSYLLFQNDDDSSTTGTVTSVLLGAVAGFAVGMFVAQRVGGFSGIANRMRRGAEEVGEHLPRRRAVADDFADEYDDYEGDELATEGTELEERVLEAFRNDPILNERAVDIGGIGEATIELAGWVNSEEEAEHAVTIAGGVPGVDTVVNRIAVGEEEEGFEEHARRFAEGEDAFTEARWEGRTVGTGRRRQGTSDEPDRH